MVPPWLRRLGLAALVIALWAVATPARAAAPQCDVRGAITFAPTPQLELAKASVDVGFASRDCRLPSWDERAVHQGRSKDSSRIPFGGDCILPPRGAFVAPAARCEMAPAFLVPEPKEGAPRRPDRPPEPSIFRR